MSSKDLNKIEEWLPRFEYHIYRDRLKSRGLPTTPTRVAFLYWAEIEMQHCFTWDNYSAEWDNGSLHRIINQWIDCGLIHKEWHGNQWYYVTEYVTSNQSPFHCKTCNRVNIKRLLETKQNKEKP